MAKMPLVLHIVAHLGGGVGKAISTVIKSASKNHSSFEHLVVLVDEPKQTEHLKELCNNSIEVIVTPSLEELKDLINRCSILQVEWWNHPKIIETLCLLRSIEKRIVIWSHTSGLFEQIIPLELLVAPNRFVFTSRCSEALLTTPLLNGKKINTSVISSAVGISELPERSKARARRLNIGYVGTLDYSKFFVDFVEWASEIPLDVLPIKLIGDGPNKGDIAEQADNFGVPELLDFVGYSSSVTEELFALDIFLYLLNPRHYGTAENALVEAMACGAVPIVLPNPAELCIVEHKKNGIVVSSKDELLEWLVKLKNDQTLLRDLSENASKSTRANFSTHQTVCEWEQLYNDVLREKPRKANFCDSFGERPIDWFLSCRADKEYVLSQIPENDPKKSVLYRETRSKGSIGQFLEYYPNDPELLRHYHSFVRMNTDI